MQPKKLLQISSLLLVGMLLSNCSLFRDVTDSLNISAKPVERNIPLQPSPKPIELNDVNFFVVTEDNYQEFLERFQSKNEYVVYIALSVRDYETLSLNFEEIKRYVLQQKEIIVFYEQAISPPKKGPVIE